MTYHLLQANALNLPLEDETVDLIVTSPPYWGLRTYKDNGETITEQLGAEATPQEFVQSLLVATQEMMRVLKPSGSIFVNLGDKYAGSGGHNNADIGGQGRGPSNYLKTGAPHKSLIGIPWRYAIGCIDDLGLLLRAEIIWSKTNSMPDSALDRVRRTHEHWFHLTKNPQYFSNIDSLREPYADSSKPRMEKGFKNSGYQAQKGRVTGDGEATGEISKTSGHPLGKTPSSVWQVTMEPLRVPKELGIDHYAAYPSEWPRRIILGWSPLGGTVLDPFGGTGTTASVANTLGRHGISVDLSADYLKIAEWRMNDPKLKKRILDKTFQDCEINQAENASSFTGITQT